MNTMPELSQFPHKTYEKLRYVDTDRQGHVNNSVFASMLETGRVEIFYNPDKPLAADGCSFVIASLHLDLHREITWPGRVDIGTRVSNIGRSSVNIEQALFQDGVCTATAKTVIVQVNNTTRRSHPLNDAAIVLLSSFSNYNQARIEEINAK